MSTLTKKKVKLTGGNGGKEKKIKTMIDIRIQVLSNGQIKIDAPKNLVLFNEVLNQASRVMEETYGAEQTTVTEEEKKVIELKPNIVIARK